MPDKQSAPSGEAQHVGRLSCQELALYLKRHAESKPYLRIGVGNLADKRWRAGGCTLTTGR